MADAFPSSPIPAPAPTARRPWSLPQIRELPKLTSLTLASFIGGGGGTGGGGSTVFALLLTSAALLLGACSASDYTAPTPPAMPKAVATLSCLADVAKGTVNCAGPQKAPGQAILGGQGIEVALRSSNVNYDGGTGDFTFDVSVQNLSAQPLGYSGLASTGVRVFFVSAPTATSGTGAITVEDDSIGTFTAAGQPYYVWPNITLQARATSDTIPWRFNMPNTVTTFAFTVAVAADVVDQGGVYKWTQMAGFNLTEYLDVAASSDTDAMAVGYNGITARWNGSVWTQLPPVESENINSVIAIGPGEYLAATGGGAVLHFKNRVWTELYRRADNGIFFAIWAKDTSHIVAVGQGGKTSHYIGGTWTDEDVGTAGGGDFKAVSGNASGTLVSALNTAFTASEVWTSTSGGALTVDPAFVTPGFGFATDLAYDSAGTLLVGYIDFGAGFGYVQDPAGDTLLYSGLVPQAIHPSAVGHLDMGYLNLADGFYYVADVDYTSLPASVSPITAPLGGAYTIEQMAALSHGSGKFLAVGSNHQVQWDGSIWADPQGGGTFPDPDLWGIGDTVWTLDGIGNFYKIVNGNATSRTGFGGLFRFWGSSSTSFYGITSTNVLTSDGSSGWNNEYTSPGGTYNDIWADPTGNAVIAVGQSGSAGMISSRILGSWGTSYMSDIPQAVWGCDAHNAWIVTAQGNVFKWTDGTITLTLAASGAPALHAVGGNSCTDVWVVGDGAEDAHWDGAVWNDPGAGGGTSFTSIAMKGPGEFYLGTTFGTALYLDVSLGSLDIQLPSQGNAVHSLWRLDNGEVYAAGPNLLMRGQQ